MSKSLIQALEGFAHAAESLERHLAPPTYRANADHLERPHVGVVAGFHLPDSQEWTERLSRALASQPLSDSVRLAISRQYATFCQDRHDATLRHASLLLHRLGLPSIHDVVAIKICNTLRSRYISWLDTAQRSLLEMIEINVNSYVTELKVESSDSDDPSGPSKRGHRPRCIAILERAYSYAKNITPAEKVRLARLTGLEPRQVVIWFQNRRNRKLKGLPSRKTARCTGMSLSPSPLAPSPRAGVSSVATKRKYDDDDEGSTNSLGLEQSRRKKAFAVTTPPPPLNRVYFASTGSSNGSSSSVGSTDSLLSWTKDSLCSRSSSPDSTISSPPCSPVRASTVASSPIKAKPDWPILIVPTGESYIFQDDSEWPSLDFDDLNMDSSIDLATLGLPSGASPSLLTSDLPTEALSAVDLHATIPVPVLPKPLESLRSSAAVPIAAGPPAPDPLPAGPLVATARIHAFADPGPLDDDDEQSLFTTADQQMGPPPPATFSPQGNPPPGGDGDDNHCGDVADSSAERLSIELGFCSHTLCLRESAARYCRSHHEVDAAYGSELDCESGTDDSEAYMTEEEGEHDPASSPRTPYT